MKMNSAIIAALTAALSAGGEAAMQAKREYQEMFDASMRGRSRTRIPGKAGKAGDKIARMCLEGRATMKSGKNPIPALHSKKWA